MKQLPKPAETVSVHWTYSREEWNSFQRNHRLKPGFFAVLGQFFYLFRPSVPVVQISPEKIVIGQRSRHFNNKRTFIKMVDLRDRGGVNILSITFANDGDTRSDDEITVPVPRGKLKEAIRLQENLLKVVSL